MSRSALLRAAASTVDAAPTAPTEPAPTEPAPTEPAPRTVSAEDVAPLDEAQEGRDEARARFVADAAPKGERADAPPVVEREPSTDADTGPAVRMTAEGMAAMGVGLLDALAQAAGPRFIGGDAASWALSPSEAKGVQNAAVPVVEIYSAQSISPEWLLLGTLAAVYLPRAIQALSQESAPRAALAPEPGK